MNQDKSRPAEPARSDRCADVPDSVQLRESMQGLRLLVRDAAARVRQARGDSTAARLARGFGKGNGERFSGSRY